MKKCFYVYLKHSLDFIVNDIYVYIFFFSGEALDIIKITLFNKSIQSETEIPHEDIHVYQLNIRTCKKNVLGTKRDHVETIKNYNRIYMTIKALYNSKLEYKDN